MPVVEVHLSNVDEREEWRRRSVLDELAAKRIVGKGPDGYREALGSSRRGAVSRIERLRALLDAAAARHEPRQRALPDGPRELERRAARRAGRRRELFTDFRYLERASALDGAAFERTARARDRRPRDAARRPHDRRSRRTCSRCVARGAAGRRRRDSCRRSGSSRGCARSRSRRGRDAPRRRARSRTRVFGALAEERFVGRTERELAWRMRELFHEHGRPSSPSTRSSPSARERREPARRGRRRRRSRRARS